MALHQKGAMNQSSRSMIHVLETWRAQNGLMSDTVDGFVMVWRLDLSAKRLASKCCASTIVDAGALPNWRGGLSNNTGVDLTAPHEVGKASGKFKKHMII